MSSYHEVSEETHHGVDRAPIDPYMPFKNHEQEQGPSSPTQADKARNDELEAMDEHHGPNKFHRLSKRLQVKLQSKTKGGSDMHDDATTAAPTLAPAPLLTTQKDRFSGEVPEKPSVPLKEVVTKPVGTIKSLVHSKGGSEFVENVANTEVSHGANVNFVLAHEKIAASTNDRARLMAVQDFDELKKVRQDSLVRWTMDRHVRSVRAVQAQKPPWLDRKDFVRSDGGKKKTYWLDYGYYLLDFYVQQYAGHYVGASSELPEPTESALISGFERVLLTSTPVQNMLTKLMSIAFWENPMETAAYAVLYFMLCLYNYVTRALIIFVLLTTLRARLFPPTIPDLRKKLERSEDRERAAHDLSELIDQHGTHGWVEPLIEKAGPTMQLQLEDMANFMEIIKNFHEWRDPRRSAFTLVVLFFLWLMITLTPVWLLVKEFFFAIGIAFFVFMPISHGWPQYRILFSPLTWLFWKIPTHGEWAIARLQVEAAQHLQKSSHSASNMDTNDLPIVEEPFVELTLDHHITPSTISQRNRSQNEAMKVGRYHCMSENFHGNLCLDAEGVCFETRLTAKQKWKLNYAELKSMQKIIGSNTIGSGEEMLFIDMSDKQYRISALKLRNEVFTQIVGYSGIEWQITG